MEHFSISTEDVRDEIKNKLRQCFDGKIVRKDLTKKIKEGANVPVYVLEFLLGQYCSSDDDEVIEKGVKNVKKILADNFVRPDEAQKIISTLRAKGSYTVIDKFSDLLALYGFVHSTRAWKGNAEFLYDKGIALDELISCREDVYAYVYDKLNGKCCENPSGQVFEIKEAVRKGKYSNNRMPAEIEKLLLECEIPEWYVESMKKILYLFPKTHLIVLLKRDICKFAKMNN